MNIDKFVEEAKKEIARLQNVVDLLEGSATSPRRKGKGTRKSMSPAARKKIGLAQKRRWEAVRAAKAKS